MIESIEDKKGHDIILIDIREQSILTDYFLVCSASNDRQLRAIANAVWDDAKQEANIVGRNQEGSPNSGWVLIDFGDLIVHIFSEEKRAYYDLESLWQGSHVVLRIP